MSHQQDNVFAGTQTVSLVKVRGTNHSLVHPRSNVAIDIAGTRIVNVATEAQLQTAMGYLQHGDTILLTNGTSALARSLYVNGRHNVTRGRPS